jgi:hypothetical protein
MLESYELKEDKDPPDPQDDVLDVDVEVPLTELDDEGKDNAILVIQGET